MQRIMLLLAALVLAAPLHAAEPRTIEMEVHGLVCAFCAQGIEKTLRGQAATADVFVSLERRLVAVALKDGADIGDDRLRELLQEAGYTVVAIQRSARPLASLRAAEPS